MSDMAPGAFITENGIPDGCVQLPVWNHYESKSQRDYIHAWFLIDAAFERQIVGEPPFGKWRFEQCGGWNLAAWYSPSRYGEPGHSHHLQDSIWALAGNYVQPEHHVGFCNLDDYDYRLCNLAVYRTHREERLEGPRDSKPIPPGMKLFDHGRDPVPRRVRG